MSCLKNIVGILKKEDCCLIDIVPIASKSGLYLDDTSAGRIPLKPMFYKNYDGYDRIIPEATVEAMNQTKIKFEASMTKKYRQFQSLIGYRDEWTDLGQATADYYYLSIKPLIYTGPNIRLNEIKIYTETGKHTGDILIISDEVELYNGPIGEYEPMTIELNENIYVAYKGDRPKNFIHRGCCGKVATYKNWIDVGSGIGADIVDFKHNDSDFSNGIELNVTFDCNIFDSSFCNIDFKNSGFGFGFASLVQLIARKNIGYYILTNDKMTPYLLISKDEILNIIEYLTSEIDRTLNYLKETYNYSDCYICNGLYKGEILV